MRASRWGIGLVLVAMLVASCSGVGGDTSSPAAGGGSADAASSPAGGSREAAAPAPPGEPTKNAPGGAGAAGAVRLADLGNRIVRTATVELEVAKGDLGDAISRATDIVAARKGIYVGSTTSVPSDGRSRGEVTFRVPVPAFEGTLRELKGLGTYRGEKSSTEDVTGQYVDLKGQLAAWRAQERVYLRLLDRARSISDAIAVQNQLQQVQSNIERLQGQVNYLEDQSSFSTIVLNLAEPGAIPAAAQPRGTFAKAWHTALSGLTAMGAAALVAVVWLIPVALLAGLVLLVVRAIRRPRPAAPVTPEPGSSAG
ncbi:MAG TPA: DUF4349 domain-containing protein [Actinomycetes bacterium]|jgi:hypothetical protein|nr:DUF4349 domain-containing protein [Actinomycetes bacterium]